MRLSYRWERRYIVAVFMWANQRERPCSHSGVYGSSRRQDITHIHDTPNITNKSHSPQLAVSCRCTRLPATDDWNNFMSPLTTMLVDRSPHSAYLTTNTQVEFSALEWDSASLWQWPTKQPIPRIRGQEFLIRHVGEADQYRTVVTGYLLLGNLMVE